MHKPLNYVIAVALVAAAVAAFMYFDKNAMEPSGTPRACTMEAKVCPDGSAVGRTGPNCEFAPCP